jgi:hypothetical protein
MSTKITLKTADQRDEGVQVHLETLDRGGAVVTIAIPEETAKELGLI